MNNREIAEAFTQLCREGKFDEAGKTYWADGIVSLEPMEGDMARTQGRQAVTAKGAWWGENHEIHALKVEGPFMHGDAFAVRFEMEITPKGQARTSMIEIALYTLRDGKIAEEKFFYG